MVTHGIKTLDTKLGTRANLYQPPVFIISLSNKPATEDEGSVLYGGVEWSGNFRIDLEVDPQDNLRIIAGINNYASPYTLDEGKAHGVIFIYLVNYRYGAGRKYRGCRHNPCRLL